MSRAEGTDPMTAPGGWDDYTAENLHRINPAADRAVRRMILCAIREDNTGIIKLVEGILCEYGPPGLYVCAIQAAYNSGFRERTTTAVFDIYQKKGGQPMSRMDVSTWVATLVAFGEAVACRSNAAPDIWLSRNTEDRMRLLCGLLALAAAWWRNRVAELEATT